MGPRGRARWLIGDVDIDLITPLLALSRLLLRCCPVSRPYRRRLQVLAISCASRQAPLNHHGPTTETELVWERMAFANSGDGLLSNGF
jgi:hypothetical protein